MTETLASQSFRIESVQTKHCKLSCAKIPANTFSFDVIFLNINNYRRVIKYDSLSVHVAMK